MSQLWSDWQDVILKICIRWVIQWNFRNVMTQIHSVCNTGIQGTATRTSQWYCPWSLVWPCVLACICQIAASHWRHIKVFWFSNCCTWIINPPIQEDNMHVLSHNGTAIRNCSTWPLPGCTGIKARQWSLVKENICYAETQRTEPCYIQVSRTGRLSQYNLKVWYNLQLQYSNSMQFYMG